MADGDRRVELVGGRQPPQLEAGRVGIGLLVGLLAGHRALLGAATGRLAFEAGLGYFVGTVLVSVGGAIAVGVLYDRFTAKQRAAAHDEETSSSEGSQDDPGGAELGNHVDSTEEHGPVGRAQ